MERLVGPGKQQHTGAPRGLPSVRSLKALQTTIARSGPAAMAGYTIIGAIILLGGIGYAIDEWQDTSPWFLFGGLILGLIVGFYELAKIMWRR
jgi:F0F1-type ATP synthase assembly protein I